MAPPSPNPACGSNFRRLYKRDSILSAPSDSCFCLGPRSAASRFRATLIPSQTFQRVFAQTRLDPGTLSKKCKTVQRTETLWLLLAAYSFGFPQPITTGSGQRTEHPCVWPQNKAANRMTPATGNKPGIWPWPSLLWTQSLHRHFLVES